MNSAPSDDQFHGPEHVADLRALLDELLNRREHGPAEAKTRPGHAYTEARIKMVAALASHTHRLGGVVALLTDQGYHVETAPTVRSAFEHALTLQWLVAYGDDAMWGVVNEGIRQRRNAGETLAELSKIMELDEAHRVLDLLANEPDGERSGADRPARVFKTLCDDIERGTEFYFTYRALSAFVHPGVPIAERYVETHIPLEIRLTPRPVSDPITWLYPTCCALIWAARAVDILDGNHPNREFLRAQARRLDIPVQMTLTDLAVVRRNTADRERRLAKRAARG